MREDEMLKQDEWISPVQDIRKQVARCSARRHAVRRSYLDTTLNWMAVGEWLITIDWYWKDAKNMLERCESKPD